MQDKIGYLLRRPVGRSPHEIRLYYASFRYQAQRWNKPRHVGGRGIICWYRRAAAHDFERNPGYINLTSQIVNVNSGYTVNDRLHSAVSFNFPGMLGLHELMPENSLLLPNPMQPAKKRRILWL